MAMDPQAMMQAMQGGGGPPGAGGPGPAGAAGAPMQGPPAMPMPPAKLKKKHTKSKKKGVKKLLTHIDYWREAPVWTPESIATATADWFKYLGQRA